MLCFKKQRTPVHRYLKLPRFWSEALNSVRFLHLSTTARRNSPYSNPFSQAKAKAVTGREDWRCVRDGDAHEKQISTPTFFPSQPHSCDKTIFERSFWKGFSPDMSTCCSLPTSSEPPLVDKRRISPNRPVAIR